MQKTNRPGYVESIDRARVKPIAAAWQRDYTRSQVDKMHGVQSVEKTKIKLWNTVLENVLNILYSRLQASKGKEIIKKHQHDNYADKILREVSYHYVLRPPFWDKNKLSVQERYYVLVTPGSSGDSKEMDLATDMMLDALIFTGRQLQTGKEPTVLIEIEYLEHWQDLIDRILTELKELFSELPSRVAKTEEAIENKQLENNLIDANVKVVDAKPRDQEGEVVPEQAHYVKILEQAGRAEPLRDLTIINMFNNKHERNDIARSVSLSPIVVSNYITQLRKILGEEVVPYKKRPKKKVKK